MFAQSRGAQAVVEVLDPKPGERVLDLCAGPGVKTVAIAARLAGDGEVVAVEKDPGRARQVEELCERAGAVNVSVLCADAAEEGAGGQGYDRVLVDPPCSDLGTLASRPDARWRKDPETIDRLAGVQARDPRDRDRGAAARRHARLLDLHDLGERERGSRRRRGRGDPRLAEKRRLVIRPDRDGTDGFFIAELEASGG